MQQTMQALELGHHRGGPLLRPGLVLAMDADLDDGAEDVGLFLMEGFFAAGGQNQNTPQRHSDPEEFDKTGICGPDFSPKKGGKEN